MRLTMNMTIFLAIMAAFGAIRSPWAVACLPVAVLTGLAFATPLDAFAVTQEKNDQAFNVIFRFGMIPLFLFSGTFFPITQLPAWIRPVAYATPLWHGVALCRSLSLGTADLTGALGHLGYLAAIVVLGLAAGQRTYRRRLHV
jgi:lipooligosaccharide transport system permease protein